jgi:vancomycin resistance protein YoaR
MTEPTEAATRPRHRAGNHDEAPRRRSRWLLVLIPALLLIAPVAAWAVDTSAGGVARGVSIDGADVGKVSEDQLPVRIGEIAQEFAERPVEIITRDRTYSTTAGEIGLDIDERATAEAALAVGSDTFLLARPFEWAGSLFRTRQVSPSYRVNETRVATTVAELEGDDRIPPSEPGVELTAEGFVVVPGQTGQGIEYEDVVRALGPAAEEADGDTIEVRVEPTTIEPRGSDQAAQEAADEAERLTAEPLQLRTDARNETVSVEALREWVVLTTTDDGGVEVDLDRGKVVEDLEGRFGDLDSAPRDATFEVVDGQVVIHPSEAGFVCCADTSPDRIVDALRGDRRQVDLDLVRTEPELTTAEAEALGIVEEIGSPDAFGPTTHYPCCQSRVTNIHRISDIVRGYVILPGETFSVNGHVGQRTVEKGFAEGGVIYEGVVTTDVGGGVSQFATTMFNAAFFAGLEMTEYQSHSLAIDRYPRGHEATISWPAPDLKITNDTDYGVLIWPEYTDTSVTVRLYSTRHVDVTIGEPTSQAAGPCTRYTTPRTRRYPDGREVQDTVSALYRPREGVNC